MENACFRRLTKVPSETFSLQLELKKRGFLSLQNGNDTHVCVLLSNILLLLFLLDAYAVFGLQQQMRGRSRFGCFFFIPPEVRHAIVGPKPGGGVSPGPSAPK